MKNLIKIFAGLFTLFTATSCLDDEPYALDPAAGHNVVEFYNVTAPVSGYNDKYLVYQPVTLESVPEAEFTIGVNWAGPEEFAPQDIVVQLEANNTAVTELGYAPLASNLYDLPTSVTIKKGETFTLFKVKVRPSSFNGDLRNALGITIKSSSHGVVSKNIGTAIFSLPVKNPYDGVYKINSGYVLRFSDPTNPTVNDALNGSLAGQPNLSLVTISSNTVEISGITWASGGGVAGINNLRATIDPVTNLVTMSAVGNATLKNRVGFENKYDPATKTLTLNFDWNQTSTKREMGYVIQWISNR